MKNVLYAAPTIALIAYLFWPEPMPRAEMPCPCTGYVALDVNHIITCNGDTIEYERNVHKRMKK